MRLVSNVAGTVKSAISKRSRFTTSNPSYQPALSFIVPLDASLVSPFADFFLQSLDARRLGLNVLHELFVHARHAEENGGLGFL